MSTEYTMVVIEKDEDGYYVGSVPATFLAVIPKARPLTSCSNGYRRQSYIIPSGLRLRAVKTHHGRWNWSVFKESPYDQTPACDGCPVVRSLWKVGFAVVRQRGSHVMMKSPNDGRSTASPVPYCPQPVVKRLALACCPRFKEISRLSRRGRGCRDQAERPVHGIRPAEHSLVCSATEPALIVHIGVDT